MLVLVFLGLKAITLLAAPTNKSLKYTEETKGLLMFTKVYLYELVIHLKTHFNSFVVMDINATGMLFLSF